MPEKITVSPLPKTWVLDLDGTIVKHNGYKMDGYDTFLSGAKEFLQKIAPGDMIIFVTSRPQGEAAQTEKFLKQNHIRYDHIIYNAPYGERILANDRKPSGIKMAIAVNPNRDEFMDTLFEVDKTL